MSVYLDHDMVPRRPKAVKIALVKNVPQILDYAAGGFHSSVDQGLKATHTAKTLWIQAATAYSEAYHGIDGAGVSSVAVITGGITDLKAANAIATKAKAAGLSQYQAAVQAGLPAQKPPPFDLPGEGGFLGLSTPMLIAGGAGLLGLLLLTPLLLKRRK